MKKIYSFVILISLLSSQANALLSSENGALDQINNSIALNAALLNLGYKESFIIPPDNPRSKSTEAGTVLGFALDAKTTFFRDFIYLNPYLDYYTGRLKYDGVTQRTYVPVVTKNTHSFFNAGVKIGPVFTFTENHTLQVIPYIGVGFLYWGRSNDSSVNKEKYYHYKAIAGVKMNWLVTDNFILSPYFEGGGIFSARMKCPFVDLSWSLGKKPIYEGGIELNYRLFDEFFLNGFVNYTQFKYGRSEWKRSGVDGERYCEPDSNTREIKASLGVRYSWVVD